MLAEAPKAQEHKDSMRNKIVLGRKRAGLSIVVFCLLICM